MSHFSVGVIHKKGQDVEVLLAPYQENNMGDCPREFMTFNDVTDEYMNEYQTENCTKIITKDGEMISIHNIEKLKQKLKYITYLNTKDFIESRYSDESKYYYPKGIQYEDGHSYRIVFCLEESNAHIEEMPVKEVYTTFDEYMEKYVGYEKDEKTGTYGYWENPNAKWDWYEIGGRWSGILHDKAGKKTNSCLIKDIDFDFEKEKEIKKYTRYWEVVIEKSPLIEGVEKKEDFMSFYKDSYYIEKYKTKENFVKIMTSFSTFATITTDGNWNEAGTMGWFGMSSETLDEAAKWESDFYDNFIKGNEDMTLTIVDCHI